MYTVYFLQSLCHRRKFYIGVTHDVEKRLKQHNSGHSKSTKPYVPWKVIKVEEYKEKSEAYRREFYLKFQQGYLERKQIQDSFGEFA